MLLGPLRRAFSTLTAVSAARTMGPVQESIERKLTEGFKPTHLVIKNDSHKHVGHADLPAGAGEDSETHFRVEITAAAFEGRTPLQRHRMVYEMLSQELEEGVHALSVKATTPGTS